MGAKVGPPSGARVNVLAASALEVAERLRRRTVPGDWRAVETAIALLVAVYADPSKLGGTKQRADGTTRQHPAVLAAARAIGRSPDAVIFKVMNLRSVLTRGARGFSRGAALDRETVHRYGGHLDLLLGDVVDVAKTLPGVTVVVDALVPRAIASGTGDEAGSSRVFERPDELETEQETTVLRRKGQGVFRSRVLSNYGYACAFCGLRSRMPEDNSYLLLASHIRPWAVASGHERLDPSNGLSLCAIHDRAFEWGFLTVDDGLHVVASEQATHHYAPEERVQAEILKLNGVSLIRPRRHFTPPAPDYLRYHRDKVFDRRFRVGA